MKFWEDRKQFMEYLRRGRHINKVTRSKREWYALLNEARPFMQDLRSRSSWLRYMLVTFTGIRLKSVVTFAAKLFNPLFWLQMFIGLLALSLDATARLLARVSDLFWRVNDPMYTKLDKLLYPETKWNDDDESD